MNFERGRLSARSNINLDLREDDLCRSLATLRRREATPGISIRRIHRMPKTFLCFVLMLWSTSAIAIECKNAKPDNAKGHWAWRQIDGKQCWYEGERGLAKDNLYWQKAEPPKPMPQLKQEEEQSATMTAAEEDHSTPETVTVKGPPISERTWYDELLLNTCCWPQLDAEFVSLPMRNPIELRQSNSASRWRRFPFFTLLGAIVALLISQFGKLCAKRRILRPSRMFLRSVPWAARWSATWVSTFGASAMQKS
jgi:hypothetical protein